MSRLNSLRFLLLHKLSKSKSRMSEQVHKDIAYSLKISTKNNNFNLNWKVENKTFEIETSEKKFNFYIKSEFDQTSRRDQIDENEINAENLVSDIISKSIS